MNKPTLGKYVKLAKSLNEVQILWLTLTFFPGETISTLNKTGDFLRTFGLDWKEMYGRIRTNGTIGGLGQFFQLYHGVKDFERIEGEGDILTTRPMRLMPSYIPHSFKNSIIQKVVPGDKTRFWANLYKIKMRDILLNLEVGKKVSDIATCTDDYVALAILARLGIIK